ncbi:OsmC family protein [Thermomonospora cellulosilytica]|uniref:OsmC family protein n=1 Tax=Thermomonospora cellulosilytica TaxID=1411118 RepID=A0A7W3MVR8_9ACTN|nr:hypothetical protein [Thermomonospora cellulosilytica]MBA9002781.1 hypothetical protein [Thermomonospora cellulosilytica]
MVGGAGPARVSTIRLEVRCPAGLSPERRRGLVAAIEDCMVHNSVRTPPRVELDVLDAASHHRAA